MIIRHQALAQLSVEENDEISIDFERLLYVARKKAVLLAKVALTGVGIGLGIALYQFGKPPQGRLETELLFVGGTGTTGMTEVTGVREIDSTLSTFDPQMKIQELVQAWPALSLLEEPLRKIGLRRVVGECELARETDVDKSKKSSTRILVQDGLGKKYILLVDLQSPRNKPVRLSLQGELPESRLKILAKEFVATLNQQWGQQALAFAQIQRPYAEKVRAQLVKEPVGAVQNLPQVAQPIQIVAELSLLSNYQRIRLIDQFLDKLENWPSEIIFAYPGKQSRAEIRPSLLLWVLPVLLGGGSFLALLIGLNLTGPLAGRVLSEGDVAPVHPAASVYSIQIGSAQLVNLLAASLAHGGQERRGKIAVFVPPREPELVKLVSLAAEKSGNAFTAQESVDKEVCIFSVVDPSDRISGLPMQGFTRIILAAKKGESTKLCQRLLQAEADLAGVPITDVILI